MKRKAQKHIVIDPSLHQQVKVAAALQGTDVKSATENSLRQWLDGLPQQVIQALNAVDQAKELA